MAQRKSSSGSKASSKGSGRKSSSTASGNRSRSGSKNASSRSSSNSRSASKSRSSSKGGQDAIALLKEDHKKVKGLLSQLEKTDDSQTSKRTQLLAEIEMELKVHTEIEEEIFYPAYKQAATNEDEEELFYEATEEHDVVKSYMPKVKGTPPDGVEFAARAKVLKDLVEHHAEEEETEMFPKARKHMGRAELRDLGAQLLQRKQELMGKR